MDREEAIEKLKSQRNVTCNGCLHAVGWCESHCRLSEAIDMAIEALRQPEPKEGHWINGKCDLCGEHAPFWAMASTYRESNYCPCCGAKMKGATT